MGEIYEACSGGWSDIRSSMKIGSDIQIILRLLPRQSESLQRSSY
jgi:hypothetical protein